MYDLLQPSSISFFQAVAELEKLREELERTQATLGKSQLTQDKLQNSLDKAQGEVDHLQERLDKMIAENRRVQLEKEKLMYDFENLQSQLDKALGQAARIQKERESVGLDSERLREKADKAQVKYTHYSQFMKFGVNGKTCAGQRRPAAEGARHALRRAGRLQRAFREQPEPDDEGGQGPRTAADRTGCDQGPMGEGAHDTSEVAGATYHSLFVVFFVSNDVN